ncbi:MAG: S1-like domain-containing RNA-binding protein [Saprospiraceae bacterium]|jgi:predicted RNA-binding protein (virulence factor B family)|nr:S1-like domain-containing RNA-binding protein [Saprospiraceae bacterium]
MAELGKKASLRINRKTDFGFYLDGGSLGEILMPKRYITPDMKPGDEVEVFVFLDGEERLVATTEAPIAQVGEFGFMKVSKVEKMGAFLQWGVSKELLVPFSEQRVKMEEGKSYLVFVYVDKLTDRVAASMKLEKFFSKEQPVYQIGQEVSVLIWVQTDLGYKVIVDGKFLGMLYKNEVFKKLTTGMSLMAYVKKLRDDGKIDLALEKPGFARVNPHEQKLLELLQKSGGFLPYGDKTDPEVIYKVFGMSKKMYKQLIGALFKQKRITIAPEGIRLVG